MTKKLMVMAGGTGGHIFPALAVAQQLAQQGWQIRWLGTADRLEATLVPQAGIEIDFIQISGLRGKGIKALVLAPWHILRATWQARKMLQRYQPDAVLGMGGYVSGPGGIAAWLLGIPIILHEQNGIAGLTNRWLAKIASTVLQAFPGAFKQAEVVGNPVRSQLLALAPPQARYGQRSGPIRILVVGGSQGAQILNQIVPAMAENFKQQITLWHQVGKGKVDEVYQLYQQKEVNSVKINEFIDDMAQAYDWADLVICRSGALTVSEIAAVGLVAIFVPFPHQDRQQYWNALPLQQLGVASIIEQPQFTVATLSRQLSQWLDRTVLSDLAQRAREGAIRDATQRVAQAVIEVANRKK